MSSCNGCSGGCGGCSGCGNSLELSSPEIQMLRTLGQIPFLPVARRADSETPVYREDNEQTQETYSLVLTLLEKKGLISLDYEQPLRGFDMSAYREFPIHGSMALTLRGQQVLDLLEIQGVNE